jgi:hypothetical protein
MDVFELTHKTTGYNVGGFKIDVSIVGRGARAWSIEEAGRLWLTGQARFLYRGEWLTNLSILPEGP